MLANVRRLLEHREEGFICLCCGLLPAYAHALCFVQVTARSRALRYRFTVRFYRGSVRHVTRELLGKMDLVARVDLRVVAAT
jgi:hypothetical protein